MNYFPAKEAPEPAFAGTDASLIMDFYSNPSILSTNIHELRIWSAHRSSRSQVQTNYLL